MGICDRAGTLLSSAKATVAAPMALASIAASACLFAFMIVLSRARPGEHVVHDLCAREYAGDDSMASSSSAACSPFGRLAARGARQTRRQLAPARIPLPEKVIAIHPRIPA